MQTTAYSTEAVWSKLSPDLWKFIRKRVSDDHTADDLLQSSFVQIHRGLATLKNSEQLGAWVYRIARNQVYDHYRRSDDDKSLPEELEAEEKTEPDLRERAGVWLGEMISQLPEKYRVALQLSELDGLSQQEVADRLGISLSGGKSRVQRGRALLKKALDDCCWFHKDARGNVMECESKPDRKACGNCSSGSGTC